MKVKILEKTGIKHMGVEYHHDDEVTVDDATGIYFCECGWAEDVSGDVATGTRDVNAKKLFVDDAVIAAKSEVIDNG